MTPDQFRAIIREEVRDAVTPLGAELVRLATKVDAIQRDLLNLRTELQGVVDERFRPIAG